MPKRTDSDEIAVYVAPIVAALVISFAMVAATPRPALANAAIAKRTGQPCAKCHSAPPALNAYGKKYQAHHKK